MKTFNLVFAISAALFLSSCLKTRSELGEGYQSQVYSKKQAENQKQAAEAEATRVDEKDELIRTLNGRVESLENQIQQMQKEKQDNADAQKIQLLQESLIKMEAQIAKLEGEMSEAKTMAPSDTHVATGKPAPQASAKNSFDVAQDYFSKKDFKNAILEYQKFVDANAKSKSKHVPEAKYKIGLCFESMGLKDEAQSFYEEVAAQHGNTEFGKKAKQKVTKKK